MWLLGNTANVVIRKENLYVLEALLSETTRNR